MHDNIRASKAVNETKSMVFLIPMVNRRNYSSLRSDCLYWHKENFKTLLAVFANTVLLLLDVKLLVYGEKRQKPTCKPICLQYATPYSTTQVGLLFEIFQISPICGSNWDKLGTFQNSYRKNKSLTYKLISPERSNHTIFMEKAKVAMYLSRFIFNTAIWQFTSVWIR